MKYLIILGTPPKYRKQLWLLCNNIHSIIQSNHSYYSNLLTLSTIVKTPYSDQIDKDLKRSKYRDNPSFIEKLRNVLTCYALRTSSIGYCQGFSFIAEVILNIMINGNENENDDEQKIEVNYINIIFYIGRNFLDIL